MGAGLITLALSMFRPSSPLPWGQAKDLVIKLDKPAGCISNIPTSVHVFCMMHPALQAPGRGGSSWPVSGGA